MIDSKDISVVVQGVIDKLETPKCLKKIRAHLPGAEIVLSTWENSDFEGCVYDILVLSNDPGGIIHNFASNQLNNSNRQLISTQNGIEKTTKKYCLKLRSDLVLQNARFLEYFDKFPAADGNFKIFEHRILSSSIFAREFSCETKRPLPFHPSDFWLFGLTEDLKKYFSNTPTQNGAELADYNLKYPHKLPYANLFWQYAPEQYFCVAWVKQFFPDIQFNDWTDWNEKNIEQSRRILYNNFVFLGLNQSGIDSKKHSRAMRNEDNIYGLLTYHKFQIRYKEYCDKDYTVAATHSRNKLNEHLVKFRQRFKEQTAVFSEMFSILYYFAKGILNTVTKK
jgi:hypothetical protein